MVKRSKRVVGIAMAGVMAISTVYKVAGSINEVRVAKADNLNGLYNMSSELADAKAKISHLTKSLKTNYLGIKNQGQWEVYVNEARNLIAKIPLSEGETALELTTEVDKDMELINALARINKVEKSYEVNFRGIKNAKQWREYLNLASKSLKLVDQGVFANQYGELISRMNLVSGGVKKIEDDFKKEIEAATKLYEKAKELMKIEDVNKALLVAEKLGSCEESETLKTKIKELKGLIEKGNIDVRSIAVEGKTYDDDTKDQILTLIVNGEAMNINYLRGSGYEVNFVQTSEPNSGDKLFDGQSRTSKTGKLANVITTGNYEVEVTVSKKGNIFVSNRAKIVVENIGSIATSISGFELTNFAEDRDINDPTISAQIKDDIIQKSRTLVVGEDAKITSINTPEVKNIKGGFEIKSSNDAVISVGNRKGVKDVITANSPGEAKLTITYGKAVQEIKITVKSASRKATKIVYRGGYIATAKKQIVDVKVSIYDQYGDPIASVIGDKDDSYVVDNNDRNVKVEALNTLKETVSNKKIIKYIASSEADKNGEAVLKITAGDREGEDTLVFKNEDGDVLEKIDFKVIGDSVIDKSEITLVNKDNYSKETNIDKSDDDNNSVRLEVKNYNKQGIFIGTENISGYTVRFDENILQVYEAKDNTSVKDAENPGKEIKGLVKISNNIKLLDVVAKDKGRSDISIYNDRGILIAKTSINVKDTGSKIKSVKWLDKEDTKVINYIGEDINYEDILDVVQDNRSSSYDPIVNGVETNPSTNNKIRISNKKNMGYIYIDKGTVKGIYDDKDLVIGILQAKVGTKGSGQLKNISAIDQTKLMGDCTTDARRIIRTMKNDKGIIIFTIKDAKIIEGVVYPDDLVATTSIKIDS